MIEPNNVNTQFKKTKKKKSSLGYALSSESSQVKQDDLHDQQNMNKNSQLYQANTFGKVTFEKSTIVQKHQDKGDIKQNKISQLYSISQFPSINRVPDSAHTLAQNSQICCEPISETSETYVPSSGGIIRSSHMISNEQIEAKYSQKVDSAEIISKNHLQISNVFQYKQIDQAGIIETFKNFCEDSNMKVQSVDEFKINTKGSYKSNGTKQVLTKLQNILHFCLPNKYQDPDIFQLKLYKNRPNKGKIIYLNGSEQSFKKLTEEFCNTLWKIKKISCSMIDDVKYFLYNNNKQAQVLVKKMQNFIMLNKNNQLERECGKNIQLCQILTQVKHEEERLKNILVKEYKMLPSAQRLMITKFYGMFPFRKIIKQALKQQNINQFNQKRSHIKQNNSIRQIFSILQISALYKTIQTQQSNDFRASFKFPFLKSINTLQSLKFSQNLSPYQYLQTVSFFLMELYRDYNQYYQDKVKGSREIEQLELCIYCLLMCENNEIWETIRFLIQFGNGGIIGYSKQLQCLDKLEKAIYYIIENWK